MINSEIDLSKTYSFLQSCNLKSYIHGDKPRASILVFPGGAYHFVSPREGEPVALRFFKAGYNAFILTYSTRDRMPKTGYPMQLLQAVAAVLYIKNNSAKLFSTKDVITCGFSAGGHLAAMSAVYYDRDIVLEKFGIKSTEARPSAAILCYAVLSAITNPHVGSFVNLTGSNNTKEHLNCSTEFAIDKNTPPMFLWHTFEDNAVSIANSLVFANKLAQNNVPFEIHTFEKGCHGLSMCDETTSEGNDFYIMPDVAKWFDLCVTWLKKRF